MQTGRSAEGFVSKGRLVYSVCYWLEAPPPRVWQVIVPLDREGNSRNGLARPIDRQKKIVQVRPGDEIQFKGKTFKVTAVEAYRFLMLGGHSAKQLYPSFR